MNDDELQALASQLARHPAVMEKATIARAYEPAQKVCGAVQLGDDCAAMRLPQNGAERAGEGERSGHLLFAAEGMLRSFLEEDPWFCGYSAVMVNLSDIAAMGGIPTAITNVLWKGPEHRELVETVWEGMRAASKAYDVPIVGGHTTQLATGEGSVHLAASVVGSAGERLLTSFDAQPGDHLVSILDMRGAYRGDKPFWNASTSTAPPALQHNLRLLSHVAQKGLSKAAKDISNGGIIGTLLMFMECSEVGAVLDLEKLPRPPETSWLKWLTSFPSYGYLLAVKAQHLAELRTLFEDEGLSVAVAGAFTTDPTLMLKSGEQTVPCKLANLA